MAKINSYTLSPLSAEDVFVFSAILCDNEIDRDFEQFSVSSLETLKEMFIGKTAILNHSMRAEDQSARTFKTEVISDGRKNSLGEDYVYLKAWAYMVRTDKNADMIKDIEAGIKKEVSVSCSVKECICSVCGKNLRSGYCEHTKGKSVDGKLCYSVLNKPTDAYEWSFVAVPAQKNAGVTKSFGTKKEERTTEDIIKSLESDDTVTLTGNEKKMLLEKFKGLEEKASDGEEYRSELIKRAIALSSLALPDISADKMGSICSSLSVSQLKNFIEGLEKKEDTLPLGIQTQKKETNLMKADNASFKI